MQCKKLKTNGDPCQANAMANSSYCYLHNPEISEDEKKAVQASGGKGNAIVVKEPLPPVEITAARDVITLLTDTINRVRAGTLEVRIANSIGVLSGQLIKAFEVATIENRVEIIERAIFERKTTIH